MESFALWLILGFLVITILPIAVVLSLLIAHPWLWWVLLGVVLLGLWYLATHAEELARKLGPKDTKGSSSLKAEARLPKKSCRG